VSTLVTSLDIGLNLLKDKPLTVVLDGGASLELEPLELTLLTVKVDGRDANNALGMGGLHNNRRLWAREEDSDV